MALFGGIFGKKKELKGADIATLFKTIVVDQEPIIIKTKSARFVTDIMDFHNNIFHVRNILSRDEVLYQLKGKPLLVQIPYQLTLYAGPSMLTGLGMVNNINTLKLRSPELLTQEESRGALRIARFPETPIVTFTPNNHDILKGRLLDISMTGAGIRLDPKRSFSNSQVRLASGTTVIIDIRLTQELRVSTTATIRYIGDNMAKMGVEFSDLNRITKEQLQKFVVQQRKEENRAQMELQRKLANQAPSAPTTAATPTIEKPKGKPHALIVSTNQKNSEFLTAILKRKFDLLYASLSITDIRTNLDLAPNICLMEIDTFDQKQISFVKKAATLIPPGCVLMFYGKRLTQELGERFGSFGNSNEIMIDIASKNKLLIFKQIQAYYDQKSN